MSLIDKIKQKREFSGLPDSVVERVAKMSKGDVRESRALLRKYFGVFLTNKILKGKLSADGMLASHMSSKKRDYGKFYGEIFNGMESIGSVVDLGCGVNGFSYKYLRDVLGDVDYVGVEASGQLAEHMNKYFDKESFLARVVVGDLFDIEAVMKILKSATKPRVVFMFQVVDALENLERDFSKKFISEISKECEKIVLSLPTESLSGRKGFAVRRKWLVDFLDKEFVIEKDFVRGGERVIIIGKRE